MVYLILGGGICHIFCLYHQGAPIRPTAVNIVLQYLGLFIKASINKDINNPINAENINNKHTIKILPMNNIESLKIYF